MKSLILYISENIELIVAICGGIFALLQWRESNNNSRAEYLDSLLNKLWDNEDIQNFILLNDYDKTWYNEAFHRSEDKTIPTLADKTLSFMNYICYVVKVKIIRKEERGLFDYYLSALAQSRDMRHYLFDLYQYSVLNNKPFLFTYFLDVCIKEGLLPKRFKDANYFKYLLKEESCKNKNIPYQLPKEIQNLKNEFNEQLFLHSYSRCSHCKKFLNQKCSIGKNVAEYFWLPVQQNNKCSSFDFTEDL